MSNSRELYVKYKKCQNEVLTDIFGPEYTERSIRHLVGQSKTLGTQNKKTRRKLGQLILYRQEAATYYPPCDRHQGFIKALREIYENISPSSPPPDLLPNDTLTRRDQSDKAIQTGEEAIGQTPFSAPSTPFKDETFKNSEFYIFIDEIEVFVQTLCEFWDGASGADLVSASLGMFLASLDWQYQLTIHQQLNVYGRKSCLGSMLRNCSSPKDILMQPVIGRKAVAAIRSRKGSKLLDSSLAKAQKCQSQTQDTVSNRKTHTRFLESSPLRSLLACSVLESSLHSFRKWTTKQNR